MRIQNIFGNKQAPSRDIAAHFSAIEHLRFVCEGGCYNDQMEGLYVFNLGMLFNIHHSSLVS